MDLWVLSFWGGGGGGFGSAYADATVWDCIIEIVLALLLLLL